MVALLRVRTLGPFEIDGFSEPAIGSRKARTLLKVLALARGAPVSIEVLIDALWPHAAPARPADQVAVLVSRLRTVLGGDRLRHADAGYALASRLVGHRRVRCSGRRRDDASSRRWLRRRKRGGARGAAVGAGSAAGERGW